jgi:hypothetical protein
VFNACGRGGAGLPCEVPEGGAKSKGRVPARADGGVHAAGGGVVREYVESEFWIRKE